MAQKVEELERQIEELVQLACDNRVDAWDMGFKDQLSPADRHKAARTYIERFGFAQAKMIVQGLRK